MGWVGVGGSGDGVGLHGASPSWERYPDAVLAPLECTPDAARAKYRRREPEKTLLYQVVEKHLDAFLAEAKERSPDGDELPGFVEQESRNYLNCGVLSRGFCRVVCSSCGNEKVVGFSCKRRGFCPSVARAGCSTSRHT